MPASVARAIGLIDQTAILAWYEAHGRSLAFRRTSDPYAVLVSEVIAQQTQAARAAERWERFLDRFPTVEALAAATPADVLREWRGLGYDRRGLNLWRAAGAIVARHGGRVPADVEALDALPGVGPYTARAVAAIAFGIPVGAVDTNVRRVLGRSLVGDPGAWTARELQAVADASVPIDRPAAWTHALMDLGATVCVPRRPDCAACPIASSCMFHAAAGDVRVTATARRPRRETTPFPATNRWLRGRIMDRLRDAPEGAWVAIVGPIGEHDDAAVVRALGGLAGDGLIERRERTARLRVA